MQTLARCVVADGAAAGTVVPLPLSSTIPVAGASVVVDKTNAGDVVDSFGMVVCTVVIVTDGVSDVAALVTPTVVTPASCSVVAASVDVLVDVDAVEVAAVVELVIVAVPVASVGIFSVVLLALVLVAAVVDV